MPKPSPEKKWAKIYRENVNFWVGHNRAQPLLSNVLAQRLEGSKNCFSIGIGFNLREILRTRLEALTFLKIPNKKNRSENIYFLCRPKYIASLFKSFPGKAPKFPINIVPNVAKKSTIDIAR